MKKSIYKITNKLNNKCYIGQSNNPMERWKKHKWLAIQAKDKGESAIHDALREVGIENFSFEIIGWYEDYNKRRREHGPSRFITELQDFIKKNENDK